MTLGDKLNTPAPDEEFSTVSFTFTAQSTTSTLVFTDQTAGGGNSTDGMLDNVIVSAPEPATLGLLGFGALALLMRRKRTA